MSQKYVTTEAQRTPRAQRKPWWQFPPTKRPLRGLSLLSVSGVPLLFEVRL